MSLSASKIETRNETLGLANTLERQQVLLCSSKNEQQQMLRVSNQDMSEDCDLPMMQAVFKSGEQPQMTSYRVGS